jgi:retinol-binding protein 3
MDHSQAARPSSKRVRDASAMINDAAGMWRQLLLIGTSQLTIRRDVALRFHFLLVALLLGVALPAHAGAQTFTHGRAATHAAHTARPTTRVTTSLTSPAIPRTPAGNALRAWIEAFNSGDTVRLAAYARDFERDVIVGDELGFREQTGGFALVSIERSERRHIEFIVRERKSPMTAYGIVDVSDTAPIRVTARRFQPLGPNIAAADIRLDAAVRGRTVSAAATLLDTFYVSADVARRAGDTLRARSARGEYRRYGNGVAFAMRLDDDLAELTHDKHLHLMYSVIPLPPDRPTSTVRSPADALHERERLLGIKCGFDKVEVLPGNVGYIKLDMFADPEFCGAMATAAMTVVADTRALILDLRENGGGEPAMVSYVASYLFNRRTHLNDLWTRRTGTTEQFWTRDSVPGPRFGGTKPVCVLTSSRTFSGGEEFTYDLQQLQRATVVGETTGGGAHPMASHRIEEHFLIAVPFARPVNPVTHANWEGVGVTPDVKVPAGDALEMAMRRLGGGQ